MNLKRVTLTSLVIMLILISSVLNATALYDNKDNNLDIMESISEYIGQPYQSDEKYALGDIFISHVDDESRIDQNRIINRNVNQSVDLPDSIDLSTKKYFPSIGSQGGYVGSCSSWASTYYQFTYQVAVLNNWNARYNKQHQFSPKWTYNFSNSGLNVGSSLENNYNIL